MQAKTKSALLSCLVSMLFSTTFAISADGKELSASSDPADLRAYVERVNKVADPSPEQLFNQANALWWLKDYKGAASVLDKAIFARPNAANLYAFRGLMLKHLDRFEESLRDMNKAESLGFGTPEFYGDRSGIKLNLKDFQGASDDADKCLEKNPRNGQALYIKGQAEFELGRGQRGIDYLTKAIEIDPNDAIAIHTRGLQYQKLGRMKEAKADLARARSLGRQ